MLISFKKLRIESFSLDSNADQKDITSEFKMNFSFTYRDVEDSTKLFGVQFDLNLNVDTAENNDKFFKLSARSLAIFSTDDNLPENFGDSNFAKINAPAIAYPYFRSFISLMTLNAGYESVILPTFNFTNIVKDKDKKSISE